MTTKWAMLFGAFSPLQDTAIPVVGDSFSPLLIGVLAAVVLIALILIIIALRKSKAQDNAEAGARRRAASDAAATRRNVQSADASSRRTVSADAARQHASGEITPKHGGSNVDATRQSSSDAIPEKRGKHAR